MLESYRQCGHCGYIFAEGNPYFSSDHAAYFSRPDLICLTWCYSCSHVCSYERVRLLGFFPLPAIRSTGSFPINDIPQKKVCMTKDRALGFNAGFQLLRMVWNSLVERAALEFGEEGKHQNAMKLAFGKLCARDIAAMAVMTTYADRIIPLEQQIQEGFYIREPIALRDLKEWALAGGPPADAANVVKTIDDLLPKT